MRFFSIEGATLHLGQYQKAMVPWPNIACLVQATTWETHNRAFFSQVTMIAFVRKQFLINNKFKKTERDQNKKKNTRFF